MKHALSHIKLLLILASACLLLILVIPAAAQAPDQAQVAAPQSRTADLNLETCQAAPQASGEAGQSAISPSQAFQINASPGAIVLTATPIAFDAVRLDWSDVANEDGYEVEYALYETGPWITIGTVPYNTTSYIVTGLNCNTPYYFRVRYFTTCCYSDYSNIATATTFLCTPAAPLNLVVTATSQTTMHLVWDDVTNEDGYRIERSPHGSGDWTAVGLVSAGVTSFNDGRLLCGTTYYYRVIAFNGWGDSAPSNVDFDTTFDCEPPPGPPETPGCISAAPLSQTSIRVDWCNVDDEDGYYLERSPDGSSGWTLVATLGADVITYDDTGLTCGTTHYYRVSAYNSYGASTPAGPASATTLDCGPQPPTGPITLTVELLSHWSALLDWNDVQGEDGYQVERSPTSTAVLAGSAAIRASAAYTWTQIATTAADVITYIDESLETNQAYCYRVRAYNAGGESEYSNIDCVSNFDLFLPLMTFDYQSPPGEFYTISGRVATASNQPVEGVTVSCGAFSTTTTSNGDYILSDLPAMTCDLTAAKTNYTFTPPVYANVTVPPSRTDMNFTAEPTQVCYEEIVNGGFEYTGGWEVPITEYTAGYSILEPHTGARSMRIGILNPWDNRYAYSSARQVVSIPSDAVSAVLTYWLYPISSEAWQRQSAPSLSADLLAPELMPKNAPLFESNLPDAWDAQYLLVLNPYNNAIMRTLQWILSDEQFWSGYQINLAPRYRGSSIKLHWGVYNDGWGGVTSMFVDDVSLTICR